MGKSAKDIVYDYIVRINEYIGRHDLISMYINDTEVVLNRTCIACPEQYDVYITDCHENVIQLGYLRLRWGYFRADYGDVNGPTVYEAEPEGDGIFDEDERELYLQSAVKALLEYRDILYLEGRA